MENGNPGQGDGKDPSSFLSDIIGAAVTVKLNSGVVYKGTVPPPSLSQVSEFTDSVQGSCSQLTVT